MATDIGTTGNDTVTVGADTVINAGAARLCGPAFRP
jgi:hypothetical protein